MVAAFGGRASATLFVGASAIGCAIALGLPDHEFLTARHLVTVAMISAVTLLATWTARYRSDLRAAQALAERRAAYDPLTGLLNRGAVLDRVAALVRLRPKVRPALAVVLADLDHFKRINDNLGHTIGDEVLQAVGRRLTDAVRAGDLVGRFGGEEFIVFLAGASAGVPDPVDRLVEAIGEDTVETSAGPVSVTLSAGWATLEHDVSIEEAIDALMKRSTMRRRPVATDHGAGGIPRADGAMRLRRALPPGCRSDLRSETADPIASKVSMFVRSPWPSRDFDTEEG